MKSIDKLRTAARNMAKGRELENHEECNLLLVIADEIEADIAERYMLLPVDADGVPIRVGDEMENGEYRGKVTDMSWDGHFWHVYHGFIAIAPCDYTHVKPDPLKELLHDACMNATRICCEQGVGPNVHVEIDETGLAEYAERIRELMEADY